MRHGIPGLLVQCSQSIGIFVGALLFSVFARSFYYKYIIISSLCVAMSSGVIYGFAVQGWMVITGSHCRTLLLLHSQLYLY